MLKVRIGHEDVFITHITDADNISEKYHFDFNHKWVANKNDTKRITVRKIKAYPMDQTAEIGLAMDDVDNNQHHIQIHSPLIRNQSITDPSIYVVTEISKFVDTFYRSTFSSTIRYLWADDNNSISTVTFTHLSLFQFNSVIFWRYSP
jgi:hypothetical protein